MIRPTPCSSANAISSSDLLLPCSPRRAAGIPPASAMRISPMVVTSRLSPSSAAQRATRRVSRALPA